MNFTTWLKWLGLEIWYSVSNLIFILALIFTYISSANTILNLLFSDFSHHYLLFSGYFPAKSTNKHCLNSDIHSSELKYHIYSNARRGFFPWIWCLNVRLSYIHAWSDKTGHTKLHWSPWTGPCRTKPKPASPSADRTQHDYG
jgi:hypothetical protein